MPPDFFLKEVRCRGCKRLLGYGPADFRIYCEPMCANDFPAVALEERDALIEALWQETGMSKAAIAPYFGIARQRVDQIVTRRDLKAQVA